MGIASAHIDQTVMTVRRTRRSQGLRRSLAYLLGLCLVGPWIFGCRKPSPSPTEVTPSGALAPVAGNQPVDQEIRSLQAELKGQSATQAEPWARLAQAFVRKARQSSDERFYAQADDAASRALGLQADQRSAQHVRLAVLLHQHRFREAHQQAADLIRRGPRDAIAWGAMGDAAVELGDYSAAQQAYQAMVDLKPDVRSYSRGAWLRYLIGDAAGAIDLMGTAIESASPREPESRAYCRVQRADLLFWQGRYDQARVDLDAALRDVPGYASAHASRGRLLLQAFDDAGSAVSELSASLTSDPQISTRILLLEAHEALGHTQQAADLQRALLIDGPRQDPRALSVFLASRRQDIPLALQLAQQEAQTRPDLWSLDALAWALVRSGRVQDAAHAMARAMQPGVTDPRLHFHDGVIAHALGDRDRAKKALQRAIERSPRWDRRDVAEAQALLQQIGEHPPEGRR